MFGIFSERNVERGIERLNRYGPKDWYNRIDTSRGKFDVANSRKCNLQQVFGNYWIGLATLKINQFKSCHYGFNVFPLPFAAKRLNKVWRRRIVEFQRKYIASHVSVGGAIVVVPGEGWKPAREVSPGPLPVESEESELVGV